MVRYASMKTSVSTWERLVKRKKYGQSFDDVINDLLDIVERYEAPTSLEEKRKFMDWVAEDADMIDGKNKEAVRKYASRLWDSQIPPASGSNITHRADGNTRIEIASKEQTRIDHFKNQNDEK